MLLAGVAPPAFSQVSLTVPRPRGEDVDVLRRRVLATPRDDAAWAAYARALIARDTVDDRILAQQALKRAVALAPKSVDHHLALADLYVRQGYLTLARRQLRAALTSDKDSGPTYIRLGRLALRDWLKFQDRRSLDNARGYWQDAARRSPTDPAPWLGLGILALVDRDAAGALAAGREVRVATRTPTPLQRGEALLLEGAGAYGLGKGELADSAFQAALPLLAGPIRDHLLDITPAASDADTIRLGALAESGARARFLDMFWRARDPDLTTPYNEVRLECLSRGALAYFLFYDARARTWDERGNYFVRYGPPDDTEYNPASLFSGADPVSAGTTNHLLWHYRKLGFIARFEDRWLNGRYDIPWSQENEVDFVPREDSLAGPIAQGALRPAGRGVFGTVLPGATRLAGRAQLALFRRVAGFNPQTSVATASMGAGGAAGRLEAYLAVQGGSEANLLGLEAVVVEDSTFREVARARTSGFAWCLSDTVQIAQFNFDLPAGKYVVGLSARDSLRGGRGAWREKLVVPPIVPGRIELSDLELACTREPGLRADAFRKIDFAVVPNPRGRVARDQPFGIYFEIYHLVSDAAGRSRVSFEYAIRSTRKDRRPFFIKVVNPKNRDPVIRVERSDEVAGRARFQYVTADVAGQPTGPYRIEVTAIDETTGLKATKGLDFELVD